MKFVSRALNQVHTSAGKRSLTLLIPHSDESKQSIKVFKKLQKSLDKEIRKTMYLAILGSGNEFWINQVKKHKEREKIRIQIENAEEKHCFG